jgi:four helix bundle protein
VRLKAKKLDIWKRLSKICSDIYLYFQNFKDYGLKDQITRSLLSVPSNIAEGVEKYSDKDTIKFLDIARGSIAEVQTQIYIGMKIGYIEIIFLRPLLFQNHHLSYLSIVAIDLLHLQHSKMN